MLAAVVFQSAPVFLALSGVLWWSALLPRLSPFHAFYNRTFATRPGAACLDPAPAPRRFAQGMAGAFCLAIGSLLLLEMGTAAAVLQVLLLAALALRGRKDVAMCTLPWVRTGDPPSTP